MGVDYSTEAIQSHIRLSSVHHVGYSHWQTPTSHQDLSLSSRTLNDQVLFIRFIKFNKSEPSFKNVAECTRVILVVNLFIFQSSQVLSTMKDNSLVLLIFSKNFPRMIHCQEY